MSFIPPDFDEIIANTNALVERLRLAYFDGAADGVAELEEAAQASDSYNNQTGATRKSTIAYLATADDDGSAAFADALQIAESENPGHGYSETAQEQPTEDTAYVFLTVPTDYAWAIEQANAGDHAFIQPLLDQYGPIIKAKAEQAVASELT